MLARSLPPSPQHLSPAAHAGEGCTALTPVKPFTATTKLGALLQCSSVHSRSGPWERARPRGGRACGAKPEVWGHSRTVPGFCNFLAEWPSARLSHCASLPCSSPRLVRGRPRLWSQAQSGHRASICPAHLPCLLGVPPQPWQPHRTPTCGPTPAEPRRAPCLLCTPPLPNITLLQSSSWPHRPLGISFCGSPASCPSSMEPFSCPFVSWSHQCHHQSVPP